MNPRETYVRQMVGTASGPSLLIMLFDRLRLDVQRAVAAQEAGDHQGAGSLLIHAQEIVTELSTSLDVDVWPGGAHLAAIYDWTYRELVRANVERDVEVSRGCLSIVTQLAEAWREAAQLAVPA